MTEKVSKDPKLAQRHEWKIILTEKVSKDSKTAQRHSLSSSFVANEKKVAGFRTIATTESVSSPNNYRSSKFQMHNNKRFYLNKQPQKL